MHVLALNSSPRTQGQSKTELMLDRLVQGLREEGAQVEVVALRTRKIKNCLGCFTCWTKTPGICAIKDDMSAELFPKWLASDLVIYATPLYHYTVNAALKAFIERTLPVLEPFLVEHKGRTVHPMRHAHPAVVMLSVAGFPEESVFEPLSAWARFIFRKLLVAEIYRPGAEVLANPFYRRPAEAILNAAVQAGRELALCKEISAPTMERLRQPIAEDQTLWKDMANLMWKSCIAEGVTPKEFVEKGMVPRPDSLEGFLALMTVAFKAEKAAGARAVVQFDFSGAVQAACHCIIDEGRFKAAPGPAPSPDLTIMTPFDVWMDIMTGKADGQEMFLAQKYRVGGDINVLMQFGQFFGK